MKGSDLHIDFLVISESKDLKTLSVYDVSKWNFLDDKNTVIDILIPNSNEYVRNVFTKNAINNFNSESLNISCGCLTDLSDGLYSIKLLTDGGFIEERHYYRTTYLEHKFDEYIIKNKLECDLNECLIQESMYFMLYMRGIEAFVRKGDFKTAEELYNRAKRIVDECPKKCSTCG